jgi:hypothetical protein
MWYNIYLRKIYPGNIIFIGCRDARGIIITNFPLFKGTTFVLVVSLVIEYSSFDNSDLPILAGTCNLYSLGVLYQFDF